MGLVDSHLSADKMGNQTLRGGVTKKLLLLIKISDATVLLGKICTGA
jgi:hypothetical protein